MKGIIDQLDKAFESRVRLGLMSVLAVNDWVEFGELKQLLDVTDGNLASHVSALEKKGFIEVRKKFVGKKPNTSFAVTKQGKEAFANHINALEQLLKSQG
ncbi:MAG: transcriptional regulator [Salibacteraceae bacterium]|jgi:DNA-binding MarR family transcriptional regulator|nr:transcriptional regulator [Salibacteraceae bacterium]